MAEKNGLGCAGLVVSTISCVAALMVVPEFRFWEKKAEKPSIAAKPTITPTPQNRPTPEQLKQIQDLFDGAKRQAQAPSEQTDPGQFRGPSNPNRSNPPVEPLTALSKSVTVKFCPNIAGSFEARAAVLVLSSAATREELKLDYSNPGSVRVSVAPGLYVLGGVVNGNTRIEPRQISVTENQSLAVKLLVYGAAFQPASMYVDRADCP